MKFLDKAKKIFSKYSGKHTLYFTSDGQPFFDENAAQNNAAGLPDKDIETITRSQAEAGDSPVVNAPAVDAPVVDAPVVDAPVVDAPVVDAPAVDAAVDAAVVDAPVVDAAVVDAPVIDAPAADSAKPVKK